jgi:hypothetical protein
MWVTTTSSFLNCLSFWGIGDPRSVSDQGDDRKRQLRRLPRWKEIPGQHHHYRKTPAPLSLVLNWSVELKK